MTIAGTASRRMRGVPFAAAALLALSLLPCSPAAARFDPSWDWSALQTEHFTIYHHEGFRETALRAAAIAEDVHVRLAPAIGWEPSSRTHLVLADASDSPNGFSTPFPFNRIVVYLTPPMELPGFGLAAGDEWLRLVITHEYAHTLQMDMVHGLPAALRWVFGRLYFPNSLQPLWLVEGLATFMETEQTAGGRGRSSYGAMVLREAVLCGEFPSLGRMAVFPERWPSGSTPYLFGESFTRFIAERHGEEKVAELSRAYAGRTVPLLVNTTARRVYGEGYGELYRAWRSELDARFAGQARRVGARGETPSTPLTSRGSLTLGPAWSPDGRRIAFVSATPDEEAGLFVMNADGSGVKRVADAPFAAASSGSTPAWSPDGRLIYYTRLEVAGAASLHTDIYCADPESGREWRVTRGLRARDPEPTPDGRSLLFVAGGAVSSAGIRIAPLDGSGTALAGDPAPLTPRGEELLWALPRCSPDGTMIAASAMTPSGETSIRIMDMTGAAVRTIPGRDSLCGSPAWSRDGRRLFFSWDRYGIFDIYAADPLTGMVWKVTGVLGGLFSPAPAPDGTALACAAYGPRGFDIHRVPLDPAAWSPQGSPPPDLLRGERPVEPPPVATREVSPFSPSTLLPRYWIPTVGWDERNGTFVGLSTSGADPLERHAWAATLLVSPETGRLPWAAAYAYDGLYPTLTLGASDRDRIHSSYLGGWVDGEGENDYVERVVTLDTGVRVPFSRIGRLHSVSLDARYRTLDAVTDLSSLAPAGSATPPRPDAPLEGTIVSTLLAYTYAGYDRPPASIAPEDGRIVRIVWEHADEAFGSDVTFDRGVLDWREHLLLPWRRHHVLSLRLFGGTARGDTVPQRFFRLGGESVGDLLLSTDDDDVPLRGYPAGRFAGDNALLVGAEYRFPIVTIERGAATAPFYLRRLHASVFAEAGDAWDDGETVRLKTGVGATASLDMTLFWSVPFTLRLVAARGLDDDGEGQLSFTIALPF